MVWLVVLTSIGGMFTYSTYVIMKESGLVFGRAIAVQVRSMLRRKESTFVFCVLLSFVLANYLRNVIMFQGKDVVEMYHPMKLLLISYNLVNNNADLTLLLIQLYPFLVVLPVGFSLAKEYQLGEDIYISARIGVRCYKNSKYVSSFLVNMLIFTIPFLLEFILNCLAFPLEAMGDLTNWGYYNTTYIEGVKCYLMSEFYVETPYLYTLVGIIVWGMIAGGLGLLTVILSSIVKIKYNVFLFLPVFLILNLSIIMTSENSLSLRWYDYLLLFNGVEKNIKVMMLLCFILVTFSVIIGWRGVRKDCI